MEVLNVCGLNNCFFLLSLYSAGGKVKKRRRPHVLKIDVEGHDFEVRIMCLFYLQFSYLD